MKNRLGIYEKALLSSQSWEERFQCVKEAGFDFIELSIDGTEERLKRLDWDKKSINYLRDLAVKYEMPFYSMAFTGNRIFPLGNADEGQRQKGIALVKKTIELAYKMGIRVIHLAAYDVYPETGDKRSDENFDRSLGECVRYASRYGVMLAMEIMDWPYADECQKLIRHIHKISSRWLGIYYDFGNVASRCKDNLEQMRMGIDYFVGIHVKDGIEGCCRNVPMGSGDVNFKECFRFLKEHQYEGPFVVEMWSEECQDALKELPGVVRFIKNYFKWGGRSDYVRRIETEGIRGEFKLTGLRTGNLYMGECFCTG